MDTRGGLKETAKGWLVATEERMPSVAVMRMAPAAVPGKVLKSSIHCGDVMSDASTSHSEVGSAGRGLYSTMKFKASPSGSLAAQVMVCGPSSLVAAAVGETPLTTGSLALTLASYTTDPFCTIWIFAAPSGNRRAPSKGAH